MPGCTVKKENWPPHKYAKGPLKENIINIRYHQTLIKEKSWVASKKIK